METRIEKALALAVKFGGIDGAHHKDWVIDQMVRALTGCPMETQTGVDANQKLYFYQAQGKSEEYNNLIKEACNGEDGPDTYYWDEGIAP